MIFIKFFEKFFKTLKFHENLLQLHVWVLTNRKTQLKIIGQFF